MWPDYIFPTATTTSHLFGPFIQPLKMIKYFVEIETLKNEKNQKRKKICLMTSGNSDKLRVGFIASTFTIRLLSIHKSIHTQ